jgi:hypothetical protein
MASEPLTDTELAELRRLLDRAGGLPTAAMKPLLRRALDEVERSREIADDVALLTLDVRDPKRVAALERLKKRVRERL